MQILRQFATASKLIVSEIWLLLCLFLSCLKKLYIKNFTNFEVLVFIVKLYQGSLRRCNF